MGVGDPSGAHPKTGQFMNDFSSDELYSDTLQCESQILKWGLVPSGLLVFPG